MPPDEKTPTPTDEAESAPTEEEALTSFDTVDDKDEAEFDEDLAKLAVAPADDDEERASVSEEAPASGEEGEPAPTKAEAKPEKPEPEPAESAAAPDETPEPAAPVEAPVTPAPAPEQQPVVAPVQPAVVEQPQPQISAEEAQKAYAAQREKAVTAIAERYTLPKELAENLDPELVEVLPRLGAEIFMDAVSQTLQQMTQILPAAVQQISQSQTSFAAREVEFFEKWPGLTNHADKVVQFGQAYRQINPAATADEFMQEVGAAVSVAMKVPIPGESVPAAPEETPAPKFQPAAKSSPRGVVAKSGNMFEQLDSDLFADEPA